MAADESQNAFTTFVMLFKAAIRQSIFRSDIASTEVLIFNQLSESSVDVIRANGDTFSFCKYDLSHS